MEMDFGYFIRKYELSLWEIVKEIRKSPYTYWVIYKDPPA